MLRYCSLKFSRSNNFYLKYKYFSNELLKTSNDLDNILIITNSCSKRIKQLQHKASNPKLYLRISVQGGGCSGFQYNFEMDEKEYQSDDKMFIKDEAKVIIDEGSFELVKGSTIDYVEEMIKSSFSIINNPQSESACGCGSSFAIKNFSSNPAKD